MGKVLRAISKINIEDNGNITFEQKLGLYEYFVFGIWAFVFIKRKNKVITNKNDITDISFSSNTATGNLIKIKTNQDLYTLVMSKDNFNKIVEYLKTSELKSVIHNI